MKVKVGPGFLKTAPEESLYFPVSLKLLVAAVVRKHHLPLSALPQELKALVSCINEPTPLFVAKTRSCAQEEANGDISFGSFRMFPTILLEPQPSPGYLFRTNMLDQARAVMRFLISTQSADNPVSTLMKVDRIVQHVLLHRYPQFLKLQSEAFPKVSRWRFMI